MSVHLKMLNERENHLWKSAAILHGPAIAVDFRTDIFPMTNFKRSSIGMHLLLGALFATYQTILRIDPVETIFQALGVE